MPSVGACGNLRRPGPAATSLLVFEQTRLASQVKRLQAEAAQRTKALGDLQVRLAASEAAAATSAMGILHHKGAAADQHIKNEELEEKNTAQGRRLAAALAAVDTLQVPSRSGIT